MSVPLPTPDGPVMTKTCATGAEETCAAAALPAQQRDELGALALREAADRLARRDAAGLQHLVRLDAPVLGDGQQEVEDLRRGEEVRGRQQQPVDRHPAALEVPLELRAARPDLVRALERVHALVETAFGCRDV